MTASLDPNVTVTQPESLPHAGVYEGRDAVFGRLMARVVAEFDVAVEASEVLAGDGTIAAAHMMVRYTTRDTFESFFCPQVDVYDVRDGVVRRIAAFPQDAGALGLWMRVATA